MSESTTAPRKPRKPGRQSAADTTAFDAPADQWTGGATRPASAAPEPDTTGRQPRDEDRLTDGAGSAATAAQQADMAEAVADQKREAADPDGLDVDGLGEAYTPDAPELSPDHSRVRWTAKGGWRFADYSGSFHRAEAMDLAHALMAANVAEVKVDSCYPGDGAAFDPRQPEAAPSFADFLRDALKGGTFDAEEVAAGRRNGKSADTAEAVARMFNVPPGLLAVDMANRDRLGLGGPLESLFRGGGMRLCPPAEKFRALHAEAVDLAADAMEDAEEARDAAKAAKREAFWLGLGLFGFVFMASAMAWRPSMADNLYHGQVVLLVLVSAALAYLKRPTGAVATMLLAVGLAL